MSVMPKPTTTFSFSQIATAITLTITLLSAVLGVAKQWGELNQRVRVLEEFNQWQHGATHAPNP